MLVVSDRSPVMEPCMIGEKGWPACPPLALFRLPSAETEQAFSLAVGTGRYCLSITAVSMCRDFAQTGLFDEVVMLFLERTTVAIARILSKMTFARDRVYYHGLANLSALSETIRRARARRKCLSHTERSITQESWWVRAQSATVDFSPQIYDRTLYTLQL